jgi:predicted ABC-class ATPase
MGLPAAGRRVLGRQAEAMFFQEVPAILEASLFFRNLDREDLTRHVEAVEDQESLRDQLIIKGLAAFVGNGSILPRQSGVDDRPLQPRGKSPIVPFVSPPELEISLQRPNQGEIRGMGIPRGVSLIIGGGFHGKSTLLRSIERGVYNHIPGDGRENVVALPSAVKIRAEDGRYVEKVDISPFINNLPFQKDTSQFSTENASGSTSQAANIIEALEIGTELLLIDEDTSATNFIIRDARMQSLVEKEKEPITPFVDRVRQLFLEQGVSTILVMGGSGDYFDVADQVILMDQYRPHSVTKQAAEIVKQYPTQRKPEGKVNSFNGLSARHPLPESFNARRGRKETKVDIKGLSLILFGRHAIDLSALEQLVDPSQTRGIAAAMVALSRKWAKENTSLKGGISDLNALIENQGLDKLMPYRIGNLARPRVHEIAFAINRLRTLKVK